MNVLEFFDFDLDVRELGVVAVVSEGLVAGVVGGLLGSSEAPE